MAVGRPAKQALLSYTSLSIRGPMEIAYFTTQEKEEFLPLPCNSPANERPSQLSQWEATDTSDSQFLKMDFSLKTALTTQPFPP